MYSVRPVPIKFLVGAVLLLSLAGFANEKWIQLATILLLLVGVPVLAYFAYKSGITNPKALVLMMASTNASVWLSVLFWHLRRKFSPTWEGIDPYAGVAAFWCLAFLALAIYELSALFNSLRYAGKRAQTVAGGLVFLLQLGTIYFLWKIMSGV